MKIELTQEMKEDFKNASYGILVLTNKVGCSMVKMFDNNDKELGIGFYNLEKIKEELK